MKLSISSYCAQCPWLQWAYPVQKAGCPQEVEADYSAVDHRAGTSSPEPVDRGPCLAEAGLVKAVLKVLTFGQW